MEGKEEHGIFFQLYRNLPQTEMWQIISYWNTFLNSGRDLQYPTGVDKLLKCGRKRKNVIFSKRTAIFHKLKFGRKLHIRKISEICST